MRKSLRRRGRPESRYYSTTSSKVLESLARIAVKQNIDSNKLFNCLLDAWNQNESTYKNLFIRCRKKTQDSAIFLFTIGQKTLGQFPIPVSILRENNPIKNYIDTDQFEIFSVKKPNIKNLKIKDLKPGMKQVDLKAKVLEIPEPNPVTNGFGAKFYVSNVLIADETGKIRLSLWNQQIKRVSVNDVIEIKNAKVATYKGKLQLRLVRSGELTIIEEK